MKRPLTKNEIIMTKKGIKIQQKGLDSTTRALKYANAKQDYILGKQKFEDIAQPIEREANQEKFDKDLKELQILFESHKKNIEEMEKQILYGVEQKKLPTGV